MWTWGSTRGGESRRPSASSSVTSSARSLRMEPAERAKRMRVMRRHLARNDLDHWAGSFFEALSAQADR